MLLGWGGGAVTPRGRSGRGVVKEAARSRNRWYIAWSVHRRRSASVLQTEPSTAKDQGFDLQIQVSE
jgi:hypothetical protein